MAGELKKLLIEAHQDVPPALDAMCQRGGGGRGEQNSHLYILFFVEYTIFIHIDYNLDLTHLCSYLLDDLVGPDRYGPSRGGRY